MAIGEWKETTSFFDVPSQSDKGAPHTPTISTEVELGNSSPPIRVVLKLVDDISPDLYDMNFVFTYFNGYYWDNSSLRISLTVRNVFQRNEKWVSILGIAAAIGSASGIIALAISLWQLLHT